MTLCLVTDGFSPHEMPLAHQLAEQLGAANFHYIAAGTTGENRKALGWSVDSFPWCVTVDPSQQSAEEASEKIKNADVALFGNRDNPLIPWRVKRNKLTFYGSERWFKPPIGLLRIAHFRHLRRILEYWRYSRNTSFYYLAQGVYAAKDMGCIACFPTRIRLFGYLVEPSLPVPSPKHREGAMNVLWAGRMVSEKRVDTLIKAVGILLNEGRDIRLKLVGHGPEEQRLKKLAETINNRQLAICNRKWKSAQTERTSGAACSSEGHGTKVELGTNAPPHSRTLELPITFSPPVPIAEVRGLMRESDVYVLPSNGYEGWGVVVNEAMLEGCCVVASREAGSAATLIRSSENGLLFPSGDVNALAQALRQVEADEALRLRLATAGQAKMLDEWTPAVAAARLISFSQDLLAGRASQQWESGPLSVV